MKSIITTIAFVATLSSAFATKPLINNDGKINIAKITTLKADLQINAYKKQGEATFKVFVENTTNQPFTFLVKDTKGRVLSKNTIAETGNLSFDLNVTNIAGETFRIEAQNEAISVSKIVSLNTSERDN